MFKGDEDLMWKMRALQVVVGREVVVEPPSPLKLLAKLAGASAAFVSILGLSIKAFASASVLINAGCKSSSDKAELLSAPTVSRQAEIDLNHVVSYLLIVLCVLMLKIKDEEKIFH